MKWANTQNDRRHGRSPALVHKDEDHAVYRVRVGLDAAESAAAKLRRELRQQQKARNANLI